jgi:Alkylmercury lyase
MPSLSASASWARRPSASTGATSSRGPDQRDDYGMKCRLYPTSRGLAGIPEDEWLLRALDATRRSATERVQALNDRERELHRRILRAFATGAAPSSAQVDAWAREIGLDPGDAADTLARHDLVHRDARGDAVSVAYPFFATATRHRVRVVAGAEVFAMCAIDALGIAFMIDEQTTVTSTDPATGTPIEVSVPLTAPAAWSPGEAVVVTGCEGAGASLQRTCPHTNFAASPEAARALLAAAPSVAGEVLSMPEAIARGREAFGGLLERGAQEAAHVDTDRT